MAEMVCIVCPNGCLLQVDVKDGSVIVQGNKCKRGIAFAQKEITAPVRSVTSTVATVFRVFPVVPIRTKGDIPKCKIPEIMALLKTIVADRPYKMGETILADAAGTGVDIIVTTDMERILEEEKCH